MYSMHMSLENLLLINFVRIRYIRYTDAIYIAEKLLSLIYIYIYFNKTFRMIIAIF